MAFRLGTAKKRGDDSTRLWQNHLFSGIIIRLNAIIMTGFESSTPPKETHERAKDVPAEKLRESSESQKKELEKQKEAGKDKEKKGVIASLKELASDVVDSFTSNYEEAKGDLMDRYRMEAEALKNEVGNGKGEGEKEEKSFLKSVIDSLAGGFGSLSGMVVNFFEGFFKKKDGGKKSKENEGKKDEKNVKKKEEKGGEKKLELSHDLGDFEVTQKMLDNAEEDLRKALEKNPEWLEYAKKASKKFNVPVSVIFSIIRAESKRKGAPGFDPEAKNVDGSCIGLGQFWVKTWPDFLKFATASDDPEINKLKDRDRTDPEASIYAVAWYANFHAKMFGLNPMDLASCSVLYMAHHEGPGAAQTYLSGGIKNVPKHYRGLKSEEYGVSIGGADDYENYRVFLTRMSTKVGAVAVHYDKVLKEMESLNS